MFQPSVLRSRRSALHVLGLAGVALSVPMSARAANAAGPSASPAQLRRVNLRQDPFTLGVASGDPDPTGFVLWTRLAVDPLAPDGTGGMPARSFDLGWQVAVDEGFRHVVNAGSVTARAEDAHSVHVEVDGLRSGATYFYRFRLGQYLSPSGRTRTSPPYATEVESLSMSFVSCANYAAGFFSGYRRMAEDDPELVLHLGDYMYESGHKSGSVRSVEGPETTDLAGYRRRHAQYKADPDLQYAHATAPWLVVFDDHEVENNFAGMVPQAADDLPTFPERRAAAFRAYYENMPLRRSSIPRGPDIDVYRSLRWGSLATFHMLDTRSFRDDQACGDGWRTNCSDRTLATRSLMGAQQEQWLRDGLRHSEARWNLVGQQVFFAQRDNNATSALTLSMDAWDGYAACRDRITQSWVDARVRNPVVLTGDVHRHYAAELKADYADPSSASVGAELVCSSITSGGDGDPSEDGAQWRVDNPHISYFHNQRGYIRTTITRDALRADFRSLDFVTRPDARATTSASFVLEDGNPTLHRV